MADAIVSEPVLLMIAKEVYGGEAAVVVERYAVQDGNAVDKETFIKNLLPDQREVRPVQHTIGGQTFSVYHGLDFTFYDRRIGPGDPYSDALAGSIQPPKLSWLEGRRFPIGGEAYKLYRCRRLGAWDVLGDYRRALASGKVEDFLSKIRGSTDGKLIAPCFGRTVMHAVAERQPVPKIQKPSMARLRIMARDEWAHGAARRLERECLHLRDVPGGFLVLRFRAPKDAFKREHAAFEAFLEGLTPN
ncbi:MAG: hypothetical protein A2X36_04845 [Elusimicrobia bacterium GWA2_69_24]|nr:MAG: hypothetical protein A2X36_04845 [Elusimicrobia bacterium GWA2_69_24]